MENLELEKIISLAEGGDFKSQYQLGYMYYMGDGIEKDRISAAKWLQKAADRGSARAQGLLGFMLYNGDGIKKDYKRAC